MYDRDTIELALLALEEGMSQGEAAELAGVARTTVGNWERAGCPTRAARSAPIGSRGLHSELLGCPPPMRRRAR